MRLRNLVLILCVGAPNALFAQTCALPHPFDRTSAIRGTVSFVAGSGTTCDLSTSLAIGSSRAAGAFAWYSLPGPSSTFRISFRIDTSALAADSVADAVEILSVVSRHPSSSSYGEATLVDVALIGGSGDSTSPYVSLIGFCGANGGSLCTQSGHIFLDTHPPIANGDLLRFEVSVGAGADGWVRFWQNADFTDPPTFSETDLDNGALLGAQDVALGAFSISPALAQTGTAIRFSGVETPDDILFWSDFDE